MNEQIQKYLRTVVEENVRPEVLDARLRDLAQLIYDLGVEHARWLETRIAHLEQVKNSHEKRIENAEARAAQIAAQAEERDAQIAAQAEERDVQITAQARWLEKRLDGADEAFRDLKDYSRWLDRRLVDASRQIEAVRRRELWVNVAGLKVTVSGAEYAVDDPVATAAPAVAVSPATEPESVESDAATAEEAPAPRDIAEPQPAGAEAAAEQAPGPRDMTPEPGRADDVAAAAAQVSNAPADAQHARGDDEEAGRAPLSTEERLRRTREERLRDFLRAAGGGAPASQRSPRIFIAMSETLGASFVSGIQRVVWGLARASLKHGATPVFFSGGKVLAYDAAADAIVPVAFRQDDVLFMPDAGWGDVAGLAEIMASVSAAGGRSVMLVHDVFPLLFPTLFDPPLPKLFLNWFESCAVKSDALICVSKAVADDVAALLSTSGLTPERMPAVGWSHSGCDFDAGDASEASEEVRTLTQARTPFFLSVSTLEPRKGYSIALDAFDKLWAQGRDARYVIVGRPGWRQKTVEDRIVSHPEYGRRLFWLQGVSDADLAQLYATARALVAASIGEGFGLPLIEAAHHGLPAIASDIPVFREIAGAGASYFEVANSDMLAVRLGEALDTPKTAPVVNFSDWDASAARTLTMIRESAYQCPPASSSAREDSRKVLTSLAQAD